MKDDLVVGFVVGAITGALCVGSSCASSMEEGERACRHAIQANFNKTRQEAERILENQRKWERE